MVDNQIGRLFPPAMTSIGYVILVSGVPITFLYPFIGIGMALIGTMIAFSKTGVEIDPDSKRLRDYTGLFKLKVGDWESMTDYSDIAVLRKRIVTTAYSKANRPITTGDDVVYDICLLDKSHRRKKVIQRLKSPEESKARATHLAEILSLKFGPYSPEISASTRARRR